MSHKPGTGPIPLLLRHGPGILILVLFLVLVEGFLGWRQVLAPWAGQSPQIIAAALLLALFTLVLRALRLMNYFRQPLQGRYGECLKLMIQHNLWNNLLPMRTGEISFPVLMSRYFSIPASRSLPGLLWFRILDLHTVLALGLATLASHWWSAGSALMWLLLWLPAPWLLWRLKTLIQARLPAGGHGRWQNLLRELLSHSPESLSRLLQTWAWTWVNWLVKLAVYAWIITLFCAADAPAALTGAISGELTSVLPIHGVAGTGTYEAGVSGGLMIFGISAEQALQGAINLHLFILATTLISGAASFLLPRRPNSLQ